MKFIKGPAGLLLVCLPALLSAAACGALAADDIVINDFENGYGDWSPEGGAFEKDPVGGQYDKTDRPAGFADARFVHSGVQGDKMKGMLTSPAFTVERGVINFLIGIGAKADVQKKMGDTIRVELLVGGKVVCSTTAADVENARPGFLNWINWDVAKYKGKQAAIRVVDQSAVRGGYVHVDHFFQGDTREPMQPVIASDGSIRHLENATDLKLTGRYLLIPASFETYEKKKHIRALGRKNRRRMLITVDGKLIYNVVVDFARSADQVDWWAKLDVSEHLGKTAKIFVRTDPKVARMIHTTDKPKHILPLYDEALRPQFHFSQASGYNNDPNGLCYYDGEYHFFWQNTPTALQSTNKFWGHAISKDLLHWTELPPALRPGGFGAKNRHQAMAIGSCFSGSGNVNYNNTGGFQTGKNKTMIAVFTDTGGSESLAYSNDRGRTYKLYEGNPIIKNRGGRDPKLIWYEPGKYWVIVVYAANNHFAFYKSTNLKDWETTGRLDGYYECPEMFELPVDGDPKNTRWVVFGASGYYQIGKFDGRGFTPEHKEKYWVQRRPDFYASQCFSNTPDGRVIQVGWVPFQIPKMPFNQLFTLPVELTLRKTASGVRMFGNPIKELESLRSPGPISVADRRLTAKAPTASFKVKGQLFDILLTLKPGTAGRIQVRFGESGIRYEVGKSRVNGMPLALQNGLAKIRILVDRPMYEVVVGDGARYQTDLRRRDGGKPLGTISVTAEGGEATIKSMEIHQMQSIWKKAKP